MGDETYKLRGSEGGTPLQTVDGSSDDGVLVAGVAKYSGEVTDLSTTQVALTKATMTGKKPAYLYLKGTNILYWSKTTGRTASGGGVEVAANTWSNPIAWLDGETIYLSASAGSTVLRYQVDYLGKA